MGLSETIDIPDSGAVFTLGKSYLSENHQSYFFIKNDAIRRLICGRNQSAVVCESGRLFVWGENHSGQLGIGPADIVTKPSCVKTIKALGERVRNVAFGDGFSVILTESSKLFYSGRSVFDVKTAFREHFAQPPPTVAIAAIGVEATTPTTANAPPAAPTEETPTKTAANAAASSRKPFELTDFRDILVDSEANVGEHFVDLAAGDEHFVVLTGAGKIYGWGSNEYSQLGGTGPRSQPTLLSAGEQVRVVSCGRQCTAFITSSNAVFIVGIMGEMQYVELMPINTSTFEDLMYSIYLSHDDDQIYLVISSGEIFKSVEREGQLHFEPHNVISENIRKICTGAGFVAIVTETNKLLTTFRERSSANGSGGRLRSPRELRKFQRLDVVDAVCGEQHILVHGVQPSANAVLSSSSNDEAETAMNELNRTYTKAKVSGSDAAEEGGDSLIQTLKRCLTMKDSRSILGSKIPVFDSRRRSEKSAERTKSVDEIGDSQVAANPIAKSGSLNEFEQLEQQESAEENHTNQTELSQMNGHPSKIVSPAPTSAGSNKSQAQTVIHRTPTNQEDYNNNANESLIDRNETETKRRNEDAENQRELTLQNEMLGIEAESPPDGMISRQSNEIMFIDNGVEIEPKMSPSTESEPVEDEVMAEVSREELESTLLGEKLSAVAKDPQSDVGDIKEDTMNAVRQVIEEADAERRKSTPKPKKSIASELAADDESERTTASITSDPSTRNQFENDDDVAGAVEANGSQSAAAASDELVAVENGRMKRFIREVRSKGRGMTCRSSDAVTVEEDIAKRAEGELHQLEEAASDKTSKVCVIL